MSKYLNISLVRIFILFAYPVVLSFFLEFFIQEPSYSTIPNLIENIIFGLLLVLVINQIVTSSIGKKIASLLIVFFYFVIFIETALFLLFQIRVNAAYIYVVLNTNYNEVKEFSSVYYSHSLVWLFLFFIPLIFRKYFKKTYLPRGTSFKKIFFSIALIVMLIVIIKVNHFGKWNLPFISAKSFVEYNNQLKEIENASKEIGNLKANLTTNNETIVVVVGESTTRNNMGVYGYYRNTTPLLSSFIDSIFVYKEVISSQVNTTGAIYDAFYKNSGNTSNSLIQYLNVSGYKTYWISNQRPVGLNDNLVSKLASGADESVFLSYNDFRHDTYYDEILLPILDEKLTIKSRKVIFLHLIGTHYDYRKRYPSEFEKFTSKNNNKKVDIVDSYDNAVLYNDSIVYQIIKKVGSSTSKSAVIYFSDHGEEVFRKKEIFGHFQDNPTSPMYEIPFLVYFGPDFEKPQGFVIDESRKYIMSDFTNTLMHFTGIECVDLDLSRSLFSENFIERERMINENLDFDSFKLNEEQ
ncbi:phosphoethanolamine transferase [Seonamhaeicola sp. MEBiC1930]|uniref:phosphoethanolamine transferase n=1 Tax=Seonamhaeicola sp. MEBiC01930 TaxID=2976768 RepID=UPI003253AB8C